jgi:hypothetical protein
MLLDNPTVVVSSVRKRRQGQHAAVGTESCTERSVPGQSRCCNGTVHFTCSKWTLVLDAKV